jgi:hypothetical protein
MTIPSDDERRAQLVAGLRAAAEFFATHPDVPVPIGVRMYAVVSAARSGLPRREMERFAEVHDAAEAMGVPVTTDKGRGRSAKRAFGPVELTVFAPADEQPIGTVVTRSQDAQVAA